MPLPRSLINLILHSTWHEISELLKFIVHQDRAYLKSSASVEIYHPGDAGCELLCCAGSREFGCY